MTATPRAIRTWAIVDAVLIVILVIVALTTAGGGGSGDEARPSASASSSASSSPGASTGTTAFKLPSGNIACAMSDDGVTCTIASITYDPPAVAGCDGKTGHVIVLNDDGVSFPCETGPAPSVAGDDVTTLEYGKTATTGDYTCTSATDGVTCVDGDGTGFQLARAKWSKAG